MDLENMQKPYTGMTKTQRERLRKTRGDGRAAVTPVGAGKKRAHSTDTQPKKRAMPVEELSISEESEAVDSTAGA